MDVGAALDARARRQHIERQRCQQQRQDADGDLQPVSPQPAMEILSGPRGQRTAVATGPIVAVRADMGHPRHGEVGVGHQQSFRREVDTELRRHRRRPRAPQAQQQRRRQQIEEKVECPVNVRAETGFAARICKQQRVCHRTPLNEGLTMACARPLVLQGVPICVGRVKPASRRGKVILDEAAVDLRERQQVGDRHALVHLMHRGVDAGPARSPGNACR